MSISLPKFGKFSAIVALNILSVSFFFLFSWKKWLVPQVLWPNGDTCFALLPVSVVTWAFISRIPFRNCIAGLHTFPDAQTRLPGWVRLQSTYSVTFRAKTQLTCLDGNRGGGTPGSRASMALHLRSKSDIHVPHGVSRSDCTTIYKGAKMLVGTTI